MSTFWVIDADARCSGGAIPGRTRSHGRTRARPDPRHLGAHAPVGRPRRARALLRRVLRLHRALPRGRPALAGMSLTVAVTGATGTLGPALLARLAAEDEVGRVIALGRRKPEGRASLRQVDVRDRAGVERAVRGADV